MDYKNYYTPIKLSEIIVNEITDCNPKKVIDICCGSCNLLKAAKKRWNHIDLYGVDIVNSKTVNIKFMQTDGRSFACESNDKFELILANPPFGRLECKGDYPTLFNGIYDGFKTSRMEIEMLFANLHLLESGGVLMIIMPSSFVEGDSYRNLRKRISLNYHINKIIKLPLESFGKKMINTYAIEIINKKTLNSKTQMGLLCSLKEKKISYCCKIKKKEMNTGNWSNQVHCKEKLLDVKRGNVSSQSFAKNGVEILHTAKINNGVKWSPSKRFFIPESDNIVYVEKGDIIISRVGKSAGKWFRYFEEKRVPISDCLFRIKDPEGVIYNTIKNEKYSIPLKGVATRYITIDDINRWIGSLTSIGQ